MAWKFEYIRRTLASEANFQYDPEGFLEIKLCCMLWVLDRLVGIVGILIISTIMATRLPHLTVKCYGIAGRSPSVM